LDHNNREKLDEKLMEDLEVVCSATKERGRKWLCTLLRVIYYCGVRLLASPRKGFYVGVGVGVGTLITSVLIGAVIWGIRLKSKGHLRGLKEKSTLNHSYEG